MGGIMWHLLWMKRRKMNKGNPVKGTQVPFGSLLMLIYIGHVTIKLKYN
jgi:hypothetical protein